MQVSRYRFKKADALCLFLRRQETEVLLLDRTRAEMVSVIDVVVKQEATP